MMYVYGGESCQKLSKHLAKDDHTLHFIFSIISDDRLPFRLEELKGYLLGGGYESYDIHILGDLIGLPLSQWRVRNYLIQELSGIAKDRNITMYWYDGDKLREGQDFFIKNPLHTDKLSYFDYPYDQSTVKMFDANLRKVNFLNHHAYPENELLKKTKKEIDYIFSEMAEFPFVEEITCPFIDGLQISRLPKSLKRLDLRGCIDIGIDPDCLPLTLEKLNLSACNLFTIPDCIFDLKNLNKLLLYKNRIEVSDMSKVPPDLEFLSLYRNEIKHMDFDMKKLKYLNLGANPVKRIKVKEARENLTIGLRKVNCEELEITHGQNLTLEF